MGETLLGKHCAFCKHYQSYYECNCRGHCLNELRTRKGTDDYVDEEYVCHLWEK